jgi:hypothetical protein
MSLVRATSSTQQIRTPRPGGLGHAIRLSRPDAGAAFRHIMPSDGAGEQLVARAHAGRASYRASLPGDVPNGSRRQPDR